VLDELWASLLSASWHMPFGRLSAGPVDLGNPLPVLLIHGYGCNSGYWRPLSRVLRAERVSFYAPDLEPLLGDIDAYVPQLGAALDLLCQATGRSRVVLIGHSMGGLAAAAWLRTNGDARIAKLITIGTPHHGTALAHFALGKNSRQMRRSAGVGSTCCNAWLQALQPVLRAGSVPLVSLYSMHDNIVAPATSAHVVGAKNIAFEGIGHVRLGSAPQVIALVLAELRASEAAPSGPVQTGQASVSMPVTQAPTSTQEKPSC
jgi:triacylglycerol lipase